MDAVNPRDFLDNLLGTLPLQRGSGRVLSVPDVGLILGACLGLKKSTPAPSSHTHSNSNNFNLSSLSVKEEVAMAVVRFCSWDEQSVGVEADALRDFLCVLCPYRALQKRLQVRTVPLSAAATAVLSLLSCHCCPVTDATPNSILFPVIGSLPPFHSVPLSCINSPLSSPLLALLSLLQTWFRAVPKMYSSIIQTDLIVECKVNGDPVTTSVFCCALSLSEAPLSASEGLMLAHLLGRGVGDRGGGVVDVSLLAKIRKGDYLHASFA